MRQIQVRKTRQPGRRHGQDTGSTRQEYYDPAVRASKRARRRRQESTS